MISSRAAPPERDVREDQERMSVALAAERKVAEHWRLVAEQRLDLLRSYRARRLVRMALRLGRQLDRLRVRRPRRSAGDVSPVAITSGAAEGEVRAVVVGPSRSTPDQDALVAGLLTGARDEGWDVSVRRGGHLDDRAPRDLVVVLDPTWRGEGHGPPSVVAALVADDPAPFVGQPWFHDADIVCTTSADAASVIAAETGHEPILLDGASDGAGTGRRCAVELGRALAERRQRPAFCITTGVPDGAVAPSWGDHHVAHALARSLRHLGCAARVVTVDEATGEAGSDVLVHLRGRSSPPPRPGRLHVLWVLSHPEELTGIEADRADLILVASERFAGELRARTATRVETFPQATDHHRFRPRERDAAFGHPLVFVGNAGGRTRPVIRDALVAGLEPAIYGGKWQGKVPKPLVRRDFIANEELPALYSSIDVLLNDHWEWMNEWGFVSNRVFDALACGAVVVSDANPGLQELFGDAVATYTEPSDLRETATALLADRTRRAEMARKGREVVLAGHTFAHRARQLVDLVEPMLEPRPTSLPPEG